MPTKLNFSQIKENRFTIAIIVFITAALLFFFKDDKGGKDFLMYGILAASYYSYHNKDHDKWGQFSRGILIGISILMFSILIFITLKAIRLNDEFDFMTFYMQGQLGVHHLDFYDPNSFNVLLSHNDFHHQFGK